MCNLVTGSNKVGKLRSPVDRAIIELLINSDHLHSWPPTRELMGIHYPVPSSLRPKEIRYFLGSYLPPESDKLRYEYLDIIRDDLLERGEIDSGIFKVQYSSQAITNHLRRLADRQLISKQNVGYSIAIRSYSYPWDLKHIQKKVATIDEEKICFVDYGMVLYNFKRRGKFGSTNKQREFEQFLSDSLMKLERAISSKLFELYGKPKESLYDFHSRTLHKSNSAFPSMIILQPNNAYPVSEEFITAVEEAREEVERLYPELRNSN